MQALSTDQLTGQILGNHRLERFLGKGSLSAVYLARHLPTQRLDALTMYLIPEHFTSEMHVHFLTRFRREANKMISLHHPHILPIYAYGEYTDAPYLITPYTMHGSLADVIKQKGRCEHTLVAGIMRQAIAGIEHAHRSGFVHGTLKPENIVLREGAIIQVAGFGLMHTLQISGIEFVQHPLAHLLNIAHTFLAPSEYIAPEVVQGIRVDARSDVYSLGCILFEALAGRAPYQGEAMDVARQHVIQSVPSLKSIAPEVPAAIISVVHQALERDATRRFQHVSELGEALVQASKGAISFALPDMHHLRDTSQKIAAILHATPQSLPHTPPPQMTQPHQSVVSPRARAQHILPPFADQVGSWQVLPPMVSGNLPVVQPTAYMSALMPSCQEGVVQLTATQTAISKQSTQPQELPKWMQWQRNEKRLSFWQRSVRWFKTGWKRTKQLVLPTKVLS